MPVDHSEADLEATIEALLVGAHGYRRRRWDVHYDRTRCLDPELLLQFIVTTQPKTWEKLKQQHGDQVKPRFLKRLVREIGKRGTLDVLRKGVIDLGCKFELAYFRPESGLNEEHRRLYRANIFSVVRQLHFSAKNEKSIDLVLFLNGIPIITCELKNPETGQTVWNAIKQYKSDRDPKEPLLGFGRCLAHFAVDTDMVYMTTHLRGKSTFFLPFNRGHDGGAGNAPNPHGFRTDYLWRSVWQPDGLLEIAQHFLQVVDILDAKGKKTGRKTLIFPRYHQLDAVRGLVGHARDNGPGNNYLVEHSAGSGKSNTIAWTAHRLSGLHDATDSRVFDSIIVITDRRVLDRQLRQTVQSFEQVKGLVTAIETRKSTKLAEALEAGRDIIITTIQTFPFVAEKVGEIPGKRFAILIDEAHSSVTGEATASMKRVLSTRSLEAAEAAEGPPPEDDEDNVNRAIEETMKKRGRLPNVSFFAFTATPKNRTLELFGVPQPDGSFRPFSLYSMRQAIEEGFIKDVLRNYTTFKVYFGLNKKIADDPEHPKKKAVGLLRSYADLHPHAIRTKAEIMLEHFETQVKQHVGGQAKAMVVTRSRLHAVRYKQALDAALAAAKAPYKALVAFSGTVKDPDTGVEFTEAGMNGVPETRTAKAFDTPEYRFLIVAEKFQTGFDQPLLYAMYVDKKLSGVNCVQTLSRLNRTHPDKDDPVVLDFANEMEEVRDAFQPYYEATFLTEATDPNKLYDLKRNAEEHLLYFQEEVDAFAAVYFSPDATQEKLRPILDGVVVDRYEAADPEIQRNFRKAVTEYIRIYSFLAHILTFTDTELEKTYQFLRFLRPLLKVHREPLPTEVTDEINMESYRVQQTAGGSIALLNEEGGLDPISDVGTGEVREDEWTPLSQIISYINDNFGTDFTNADKVRYFAEDMERRIMGADGFEQAMDPEVNPSRENRRLIFHTFYEDVLEDMIEGHTEIYKKLVGNDGFASVFQLAMFRKVLDELARRSA